jgi:hypothetical protein
MIDDCRKILYINFKCGNENGGYLAESTYKQKKIIDD